MSKIEELIERLCPEGVEFRRLGEVFTQFNGMTGVSKKWEKSGNCVFIDYLNAYNNIKIDTTKLCNATVKRFNQQVLRKGDVLFTTASEVPDECAISSVIEDDIVDGVFLDDHLFGLRIKEEYSNKIVIGYLKYIFRSTEFRSTIRKVVRGVTRFYISKNDFMNLSIPLPPLAVQEEIVRILDAFTSLEAELEAELEARKKQYTYYRDTLLSFDRDDPNVEWKRLGEVASIKNGKDYKHLNEGIIPVYGSGGIMTHVNMFAYDKPTVLIPRKGSLDKLYYVDTPFWNVDTIFYTVIDETLVVPKFLYHCLAKEHLEHYNIAGGVPSLTQSVLNDVLIPLPPLAVQEEIVRILDKFEALTSDLQSGLPAEIEARRKQYEYYRDRLLSFKVKSEE